MRLKRGVGCGALVGLLAILSLLTAACGNNNAEVAPPATAEATADPTTEATPVASGDTTEEQPMDDSAGGHDQMPMDDSAEGQHDHSTLMEVDYEPVPTIELKTHLDPKSGANLEVITTGFTLAPERASTDPVAGEGHFHIYVDGMKLRRLYAHWAHVDLKEPGDYEIRVEMSANNHATLAVNGVKLDATAVVTIPGVADDAEPAEEPTPTLAPTPVPTPELTLEPMTGASPTPDAGITIEVEVAGGKPVEGVQRHRTDAGDDVTITVAGDTTDELHIHGYDLVVPFAPDAPGTITFEANIPGIFEVETHHHGDLVMELQVG